MNFRIKQPRSPLPEENQVNHQVQKEGGGGKVRVVPAAMQGGEQKIRKEMQQRMKMKMHGSISVILKN